MSKIKKILDEFQENPTHDECLKIFQKLEEEGWFSDNELKYKLYDSQNHYDNCEKMKFVRSHKKQPMSGMKKPKGIDEWCE